MTLPNACGSEIFGRVMSLTDTAMPDWYRLVTSLEEDEVKQVLAGHPREAKARLAREVTAWLQGEAAAAAAEEEFNRRFKDGALPSEIPEVRISAGEYSLPGLMKQTGLASSTSEARRLIQQGGVRIDGEVCKDLDLKVAVDAGAEARLVQAGKRRFVRVLAEA